MSAFEAVSNPSIALDIDGYLFGCKHVGGGGGGGGERLGPKWVVRGTTKEEV
jgi:hypothetical protein